jgi:hypothetical protein
MLQTLLDAVEAGGNLDIGEAMRNLESRIDKIVVSADSALDAEPAAKPMERSASKDAAAPKTAAAEKPESDAAEPAEATASEVESDSAKDDALVLMSAEEPAADSEAAAEPGPPAEADKDEPAPEEAAANAVDSETPAEDEDAKDSPNSDAAEDEEADEAAEPPSDDDLSAVNKIIQRISLLTGEFVEPSDKKSDGAEDKSVPPLKVGNGADEVPEAGASKGKSSSKDETAAKTS